MMLHVAVRLASLLLVSAIVVYGGNICGSPSDPCMNEENHAVCLELEASGCESIQVLESCPAQFRCNKKEEYNQCVTLLVFNDSSCSGEPSRELPFPTMSHPGSPCFTDATMPFYSVKNQYCSEDGNKFHQDVFIGKNGCEVPWYYSLWSPRKQVFTKDSCSYGFKLKSCEPGPCPAPGGETTNKAVSSSEHGDIAYKNEA